MEKTKTVVSSLHFKAHSLAEEALCDKDKMEYNRLMRLVEVKQVLDLDEQFAPLDDQEERVHTENPSHVHHSLKNSYADMMEQLLGHA